MMKALLDAGLFLSYALFLKDLTLFKEMVGYHPEINILNDKSAIIKF
ncbi:MAG: hypothetical protein WCG93_07685 [Paludibacter sp.]